MSKRRPHTDKPTAAGAPEAEEQAAEAAKGEVEQERSAEQAAASGEGPPEGEPADARPSGPDDAAPAAPPPRRRRRGSGEVPAPRGGGARPAGDRVEVRARARYVRTAPRKARLVIDHIRGKDVDAARAILENTPRAAARDVLKLLDSAIANAENNHELVAGDLRVGRAYVDEGPALKRYRPRALGRATRIRKRTSHMTIALTPKE